MRAPSPQQLYQLEALFNAGLYAELEVQTQSLIRLYPNSGICWKALGVSLLAQSKDGLMALQKTAQLLPEDAETHRNLGITLQNLGRLNEAETSHRSALALKPNLAEAHKNLANVLKDQGRLSEAEASYRNALKIQPDYFEAHSGLGNIFYDQDNFAEAEASHRRALEIKPDIAEAHRNLGLSLKQQGRLTEAEMHYRQAIALKPNFAYAYYDLGNMLKQQKRLVEAAECFNKCLEIEPEDSYGSRLLLASMGIEPIPTKASQAQLDALYVNRAQTWDLHDKTPYHGAELVAQVLRKWAPKQKMNSILDAGCGTGLVGVLVRDMTRRLDGVDMSSSMLEKAQEKRVYDSLVLTELALFMKNNEAQYDAITCAATLIHFGDLLPVFNAAAACLKDKGLFVFTLFPNNNESSGNEIIVADIDDLARGGCFAHSRGYVSRIAKAAGFIVEALEDEVHEFTKQTPIMGLVVTLRRQSRR